MLHTPGHSPGAVCFYAPDLGCVFTGDTLFHGGPGATGRSFSDYDTIVDVDPGAAVHAAAPRRSCTPATATTPDRRANGLP